MQVLCTSVFLPARHLPRNPMNVMAPMTANDMDADLMTRREVAYLCGVTSAAVATWARRGLLPEVRNEDGKPRYRPADVEELRQTGIRRARAHP
jgi:MerR HTH family regulatory protein